MDALAAFIICRSYNNFINIDKGYESREMPLCFKIKFNISCWLAFVYGGLTYIGAHTISLIQPGISKTGLLVFISEKILGNLELFSSE